MEIQLNYFDVEQDYDKEISDYIIDVKYSADNYQINYKIIRRKQYVGLDNIIIYDDISTIKIPPYIKFYNDLYPVTYVRGLLLGSNNIKLYKLNKLILDFDLTRNSWILGNIKHVIINNMLNGSLLNKDIKSFSPDTKIIYIKQQNIVIYNTSKSYSIQQYAIK